MFISFEGVDGIGKTTMAKTLAGCINAECVTSDPKGTELGFNLTNEIIKSKRKVAPLASAFTFLAARAQLVDEVIKPALKQNKTVICDRFMDSTIAYQGYLDKFVDMSLLKEMSLAASSGIIPDLTFLLVQKDLKAIKTRIINRAKKNHEDLDKYDGMSVEKMQVVQNGFLKIAENNPNRVKVIHVDGCTETQVFHEIVYEFSQFVQLHPELKY